MSALQKDRLRCQNYEKEKHIAKGLVLHANSVTEKEYLVRHADYFYIEESDDKTIIVKENSERSKQKKDGTYFTKLDLSALDEILGTVAGPDWICTRITTVVGSQCHRNTKVTKHYFLTTESDVFARREGGQVAVTASHDVEEEPPKSKNETEIQETPKPKVGNFQGFKRV